MYKIQFGIASTPFKIHEIILLLVCTLQIKVEFSTQFFDKVSLCVMSWSNLTGTQSQTLPRIICTCRTTDVLFEFFYKFYINTSRLGQLHIRNSKELLKKVLCNIPQTKGVDEICCT